VDANVRFAVSKSHLRGLPPKLLQDLMQDAVRMRIPAGSVTHWEGEDDPHLELVVSGIVRAFVTAPDGRTMTIRYCRPGALLGALSLFTTDFVMPATVQALVDAELLRMSPLVASRAAERDTRVARAFLEELSERARTFIYEIPGSVFASVRQRVARHLLDLALERRLGRQAGRELVAPVSQKELAEAAGTVREVVVRVLREFRGEGVIRTIRNGIVIVDPTRLTLEQGWNRSS
jgi:CRP/FNR family transcriptional regulator, cyclic AMP receptor protein